MTTQPSPSAAFDLALIQSHLDEHAARDQRQREERLRLLAEYEAEHGEISEAEIAALWESQ